jgi:amino acid adenylation domain-containing protein
VPELFRDQVIRSPNATALVFDGGSLSYSELDQRANQLANILRAEGVAREVPVALCLARSAESIVAVLGILKAGGVYVPLEPSYPEERLAFMLRDAGVKIVLSETSLAARLPANGYRVILLDDVGALDAQRNMEPVVVESSASDRAYIMYTSGSTGTPKGVEVTHRSINRLVCAVDYVDLGPAHTVLHAAPLAFDASTFEIWGPLLTGGRCAVYGDRIPTPAGVARAISELHVTTAWLTAGLFNSIIDDDGLQLRGLSQLLVGGEALSVPHIRRALELLPDTQLINGYGPTESTTFAVTYRIPRNLPEDLASIPIGRPIRDTQLYILDPRGQPAPVGVEGELLIGGEGLARGYVGLAGLDGKRFGPNPFREGATERVYRTGDIARYLSDGTVVFAGRKDTQIKLSGYRIELGEIEAVLSRHPGVKRAIVTAHDADGKLSGQLVAYLIARDGGTEPDPRAMRDHLRKTLPDYMVPSAYVWVDSLPLTGNGKLDIKALRKPELSDRAAEAVFVHPRTEIETKLADTWARLLELPRVGVHDNVFDLGASSLLVLKAVAAIRREHNLTIPVVSFFRYPTVSSLAASLDRDSLIKPPASEKPNSAPSTAESSEMWADAVAIVGMAGRYPGAANIDEFWSNLRDGKETITRFAENEIDSGLDSRLRNDPQYIRARGILAGVDRFDAGFFGMSPREAQLMDPQQRVFLEIAWEALENAGHVPDTFAGPIGVFAGVYNNSYVSTVLNQRPEIVEQFGAFNAMLLNEKDYVATRAAHKLGLTGPALSIHTACSTSLVTICQAVQSLRAGQCDLALAGGVSLTLPTNSGYLYQEGSMLSVDGSTRTFDAQATGTVFSDGAGVVVLKRLRDAVADGNRIYAVVRGVGINNDGAHKASFTAPSVDGQVAVIRMAQSDARVHPRSISYVEAHGTATPLGDPIEFEALKEVFGSRTDDRQFCALGSVKSNVGHTVIAAGAAGVIKTALALTHESIPPTLHYTSANKSIDFENSPFFVNASGRAWPRSSTPRRAGVSSFGVGGTNAHVVLEEAPAPQASGAAGRSQLLVVSARTSAALEESTTNLARHLREHPDDNLADVAYTLQVGRKHFLHRRALACTSPADGADALESRDERRITTRQSPSTQPRVVFMFPGQGAQYPGMGAGLYSTEPVFHEAFDRCASAAASVVGLDLRKLLFDQSGSEEDDAVLRQTAITQPALFAVEYSLATLWQSWGIRPAAMIGHSVGEFVCATLAGVLSVEDGMRLVAERGRVMQGMPQGAMLSVRASASDLGSMMGEDISLASDNAPSLCVVGGTFEAVANLEARLGKEGISCRLLQTSHAFHSPMMDRAVEQFGEILAGVPLHAPSVPFVSTVTGDWITASDAQNSRYWARHLRETVRFGAGIRTLLEGGPCLLLEVGPRASLSALARQQIKDKSTQSCVASLGTVGDRNGEDIRVMTALGEIWSGGVAPDWQACHRAEVRHRVPLPTYPFERQRHWVDPTGKSVNSIAGAAAQPPAPAASISAPKVAAPARVVASIAPITAIHQTPMPISTGRRDRLISGLREKLEQVSGQEVGPDETKSSFVELGFDSLVLTQVALALSKTHGVKITFRQLLEEYTSVERLAQHLDAVLPADAGAEPAAPTPQPAPVQISAPTDVPMAALAPIGQSVVQQLVEQQLRVMAQQLALLSGSPQAMAATPAEPKAATDVSKAQPDALPTPVSSQREDGVLSTGPNREVYDAKKAFGAAPRITLTRSDDLTPKQRARLDALVRRYTTRTQESKKFTQAHRARMADPRVASGFRPTAKELVYPIVMDRSLGSKMWDIDGNEYVDVLSGFGSNFFGWSPDFIVDAIKAQLEKGFDVGPQNPLAGEVAELFCELTQNERAAFCNTGSEAVLGAIRIARTVTGRDTIVIFTGSYHGINDEVIVRATKKLGAVPAAPGIMAATAKNVLVLDYGTPESLEIIRSRASQLAAVVVEPVQSRRPDFQPGQFLQDLRKITEESGVVYIWDEIVTGFRVAPRGAQEYFGIRPDLSTYGKVVGGGLPIGVIAGRREFMDALDGGQWQYGDQSVPEVGVTYFAGTFVRHPLALAAARAVLRHLKERGPALQAEISGRTKALVTELNGYFQAEGAPLEIKYFSSVWKTFFKGDHPHGDLLFYMLRDRGLHIYDGFPCFMTAAHTDADVAKIVSIFKDAVLEMRESGFLPGGANTQQTRNFDGGEPPVAGAQLGRDRDGKPAWFVATASGKYAKVESTG